MSSLKRAFFPVVGAAILSLATLQEGFAQSTGATNAVAKTEIKAAPRFASNITPANDTSKSTNAAYNKAAAKNPLDPAVREGDYGDALVHSGKNNLMVIEIAGPSLEQLKKEAQNIHAGFKKAVISTDIVVFYNVDKELSKIMGTIVMNGEAFRLPPSGIENFDAETIKTRTNSLAKYYYQHYTQATAAAGKTLSTDTSQGLALQQP